MEVKDEMRDLAWALCKAWDEFPDRSAARCGEHLLDAMRIAFNLTGDLGLQARLASQADLERRYPTKVK